MPSFGFPETNDGVIDSWSVESFLHYGYLPAAQLDVDEEFWAGPGSRSSAPSRGDVEEEVIARGVRALRACFSDFGGSARHIVLLSGGLDSRAILGELLEAGLGEKVVAATFGVPGTLDYEIGQLVAGQAGVRSEPIDLNRVEVTEELLRETVRGGAKWTYLFEAVFNRSVFRRFGQDCTYWVGFMGDPLAGSHLLRRESRTWEEAARGFAERNRCVRSMRATRRSFQPASALPRKPILKDSRLTFDEQLDFGIRQQSCIRPLVVPRGYDCRTPFLQREWVDFMLDQPKRSRRNQHLYKRILASAHPELFSLPTKATLGLSLDASKLRRAIRWFGFGAQKKLRQVAPLLRWPVYPNANYLDFDDALRHREDMQEVVYEMVSALDRRGIVGWLDTRSVWKRHQRRLGNHSDLLLTLAALEVNLRACELGSSPDK